MNNNSHGALHPPPNYNPTTELWGCLASNAIVSKVVEVFKACGVGHYCLVLSSLEDKRTLSTIKFMIYIRSIIV